MAYAVYYDGKSSKQYPVEVITIGNVIRIDPIEHTFNRVIKWKISDIRIESYTATDTVVINYGDRFPFQRLELDKSEAEKVTGLSLVDHSIVSKLTKWVLEMHPLKTIALSISSVLIIAVFYVMFLSPFVSNQIVKMLPISFEEKVGQTVYDNMGILLAKDEEKSKVLQSFYEACKFSSDYDVRIDYVSEDIVNAFALPGGQIVIYEGIINEMQSWEELAALIGHELAHVNQRHSFKQITQSASSFYIISLLTGDIAGVSAVILEQAGSMYQLSNSRSFEKEADIIGLNYLSQCEINPEGMSNLFETINNENNDELSEQLAYFSTHPNTGDRIEYINELIVTDPSFQYNPKENTTAQQLFEQLKAMD